MQWIEDQEFRYETRDIYTPEYYKGLAESAYYEKLYFIKSRVDNFNATENPAEKQRILREIVERKNLYFPGIGCVMEDCYNVKYFNFTKWGRSPEYLLRIAENQIVIKKIFKPEEYEYLTSAVYPINKITLSLQGENKKDWQRSKIKVHATLPENDRPSWRKSFLGW